MDIDDEPTIDDLYWQTQLDNERRHYDLLRESRQQTLARHTAENEQQRSRDLALQPLPNREYSRYERVWNIANDSDESLPDL
jgi:hypothetical protein